MSLVEALTALSFTDTTTSAPTVNRTTLPADILGIIAFQLIADQAYGTCAALNATCKMAREETVRILYRTVVFWPNNSWKLKESRSHPVSTVDTTKVDASREKVFGLWDSLITSRGAAYIEYLVVPFFMSGSARSKELIGRLKSRSTQAALLPRLKVTIGFAFDVESPSPQPTISPTSRYEYGTQDLLHLHDTMCLFLETADNLVRRLFDCNAGIRFLPYANPETTPVPIGNRVALNLAPSPRFSMPCKIYLQDASRISEDMMPTVFLELLNWSRTRGNNALDPCLWIRHPKAEPLLSCAKAYQKAVKVDPKLAILHLRFATHANQDLSKNAQTIDKIISVFRGTYLLAYGHIDFNQIGQCQINVGPVDPHEPNDCWWIQGMTGAKTISTMLLPRDISEFHRIYTDPWGPVAS